MHLEKAGEPRLLRCVGRRNGDRVADVEVEVDVDVDTEQPRPRPSQERDSSVVGFFCKVEPRQLPADMLALLAAARRPLPDDPQLPAPPAWLEVERLKRGQAFALKYLHGLNYSHSLALLLLFSSPDGLKPLIYTEKSHTPALARKRYLSTVVRVMSWLQTDVCDASSLGYENLRRVRAMHLSVSRRLNGNGDGGAAVVDRLHRRCDLRRKLEQDGRQMLCPLSATLRRDRQLAANGPSRPLYERKEQRVYLNQMEMACTQFGFYGLMLLYPHKFAAKPATKQELADFVHLWRYVGYMLGISDEYNLCAGDVDTVRRRSRQLVEYFVRPMLVNVNDEWEHMSRCALRGISDFTKMRLNLESTLLYLYWVLGIEAPHLASYVSWKERLLFYATRYVMTEGHKIPGCSPLINYVVRRNVHRAAANEYPTPTPTPTPAQPDRK